MQNYYNRTLGSIITDGVGFRNFIINDFVSEALLLFDRIVLLSFLPAEVYPNIQDRSEIVPLRPSDERFLTWMFRKFKEVAHMQLHAKHNFGLRNSLQRTRSTAWSPKGIVNRFIYLISKIFHSEGVVLSDERLQYSSFLGQPILKEYRDILRRTQPDVLLFTHQRSPIIAPLLKVAKALGLPASTFVFSWDNLASKGRMAGWFSHYLVWSSMMKADLLEFYPRVNERQISILGTPQFVPFIIDQSSSGRAVLFRKFDLNPDLPLIVYTCNDSTIKNDPVYLDFLGSFIEAAKLVRAVNVLVRTSPAEVPGRFAAVAEKYPFFKWNYPDWKVTKTPFTESWSQRVPSFQDLCDLKSILTHAAFTINVLSTITIDSFLFDKPVINPVFGNGNNGYWDDQKYLKFRHLIPLVELKASHIVTDEKQYLEAINRLLLHGDDKSALRKSFVDLQIGFPLEQVNSRITEELYSLAQKDASLKSKE
ncbi:hypothetical protein [Flavobacterium aurantiibacter]|uniref:UDP-glycosyltransferase n=1 Tax=Flavobacterium aurantiibacter TaxID=2023067 RepID=A0A255ZRX0_9FLAO|nr:hypothetical protein [Flavobacterium aurantiibacter]OYQ44253.1 hypothetical protein CHX27_08070 [Flavobacterium aurantiibacter]